LHFVVEIRKRLAYVDCVAASDYFHSIRYIGELAMKLTIVKRFIKNRIIIWAADLRDLGGIEHRRKLINASK
jgi:hypothetical protein